MTRLIPILLAVTLAAPAWGLAAREQRIAPLGDMAVEVDAVDADQSKAAVDEVLTQRCPWRLAVVDVRRKAHFNQHQPRVFQHPFAELIDVSRYPISSHSEHWTYVDGDSKTPCFIG